MVMVVGNMMSFLIQFYSSQEVSTADIWNVHTQKDAPQYECACESSASASL